MTYGRTPLIGLDNQQKLLLSTFKGQRFPHAWLFHGADRSGKATLAHQWTRVLLQDRGNFQMPGSWGDAAHLIAQETPSNHFLDQGTHPDFLLIAPQESSSILIEDVRPLRSFIQKTPERARYQVVIIDGVHRMTETAANALLKSLEEPKENVVFFLISSSLDKTKVTLRSRCVRLPFLPLARQMFDAHLDHPQKALLYHLCQGRMGYLRAGNRDQLLELYALFCQTVGQEAHGFRLAYFRAHKELMVFEDIVWAFWTRFLSLTSSEPFEKEAFDHLRSLPQEGLWEVGQTLFQLFTDARQLNLDPSQVLMNTFFHIRLFLKGERSYVA